MYDTIDTKLLKNFQIIKKIGQGAYGQVWKAKNKKTGTICALKKIFDAFRNASDAQKTYREIKYLQKLDHPCIIKLLAYHKASNQKQIYLELQFMQADLCMALRNSVLKQIHKHYIFYQMAHILHYLHSAQLVHRDIKPSNILLNQTCQVKLCDFGLIRSLKKDTPNQRIIMTENVATRWYRAPQVLLCTDNYGKAVDIWSLGCVLAEMVLQKPLFQGTSTISQLQKIFQITGKPTEADLIGMKYEGAIKVVKMIEIKQKKSLKNILNTEDYNLVDLLQRIFQINPTKRLTAQEILNHPFVNRFRGRIEQKTSTLPLKILYESRLLSVDDYRSLLLDHQQKQIVGEIKNKSIQNSTLDQSKYQIYKTMPSEISRNNFISSMPWGKIDKKSPMHASNLNQKRFSPFGLQPKKQITPIQEIIKEENLEKKSFSPSFLQKKRKQDTSPKVTPQKIEYPNRLKKMLTFPLKFSPSKPVSPLVPDEKKSTEKLPIQKINPEITREFPAKDLDGVMNKIQSNKNTNNYNPLFATIAPREGRIKFQNQKQKMMTQIQSSKHAFQITPNKTSYLAEDLKRNFTPTRSISPFSIKNIPLPQGVTNNKIFVFKPNPMKSKLSQQVLKRPFPVAPYQIKK